jgi:hypothetical protein
MPGSIAELPGIEKIGGPVIKNVEPAKNEEIKEESPASEKAEEAPAPAAEEDAAGKLEKLAKADLGMLSDEDLESGIKLAAANEDYILASKLRDELKGRKEGN